MSRFTKGLMAVAGMSLCVSTAAVANDLTIVSWGGAYTKSQVEAYHKPWMAKTGKTIISEDQILMKLKFRDQLNFLSNLQLKQLLKVL